MDGQFPLGQGWTRQSPEFSCGFIWWTGKAAVKQLGGQSVPGGCKQIVNKRCPDRPSKWQIVCKYMGKEVKILIVGQQAGAEMTDACKAAALLSDNVKMSVRCGCLTFKNQVTAKWKMKKQHWI